MTFHYTTFPTKFGLFSLATDKAGRVVASAFGDVSALERRVQLGRATPVSLAQDEHATATARLQVLEYCQGERVDFSLPLAAEGTEFQHRVWNALVEIPAGETCSYGELAHQLRSAPRAIGRANATNPICLIVPCHRVIGADGSLTGFAFGEDCKRRLLDHERDLAAKSTVSSANNAVEAR